MKSIRFKIGILSIVLVSLTAFSDRSGDFIDTLKHKLDGYAKSHPEETVYLQFDKPFYKPGEDIWFNAFVIDGETRRPSQISDVVYVDLRDPKGNTVRSLTLFAEGGAAKGDFLLDHSAPGGIYTVSAHTKWMRNSGEETFFTKTIQVQKVITPRLLLKLDFQKETYGPGEQVTATLSAKNLRNTGIAGALVKTTVRIDGRDFFSGESFTDTDGQIQVDFRLPSTLHTTDGLLQVMVTSNGQTESISRSVPIVLNKIELTFFPEGGDLVAGVENRVAFKALNEFGKGADVAAVLVDERDNAITRFSSFHMGMGDFRFTPEEGKEYRVKVEKPVSGPVFAVPPAKADAMALMIKEESDGLSVFVYSPLVQEGFLVGQAHGAIHVAEKVALKRGVTKLSVSTGMFPAGIAVFTIFNAAGIEEAERLVFLNAGKVMNVWVRTDKAIYAPGEKVQATVRTTDRDGRPIQARLSLSVVDDKVISFADDKQDNILSWLLLSSELRGEIQEPSFYFDPEEPKAEQARDYLMLTHGWRRFAWKDVLSNGRAIVWLPEKTGTLSGVALSEKRQNTKAEVVLLELGNRRRIAKVMSKQNGQFQFRNIDASVPLLLLTRKPNLVEVNNTGRDAVQSFGLTGLGTADDGSLPAIIGSRAGAEERREEETLSELSSANFSLDEDVSSLNEVVVVGYGAVERKSLAGSVARLDRGRLENFIEYSPTEQSLHGRVAGVTIQRQGASAGSTSSIQVRGHSSFGNGRGEPLYVIDGVPMGTNLSAAFSNGSIMDPTEISSIEVMRGPEASAVFGSAAANGVILITTRTGMQFGQSFTYSKPKSRYTSVMIVPREFSKTRQFYVNPSKKENKGDRNDFRTTVYWNPEVVTDEKGEARLSFHNNDATSAFRIVTEGVSANGLPGRDESVFSTELPFSIDTKIPEFLGLEDTLHLPVTVTNNQKQEMKGEISTSLPEGLRALTPTTSSIVVPPSSAKTFWVTVVSDNRPGTWPVKVTVRGREHCDVVEESIEVHPVCFPRKFSFSAKELSAVREVIIDDPEKGSVKAEVVVYTDVMSVLFSGAEAILQEPHGCFEQVSSSTFPNILALQFLKQSGQSRPGAEKKALDYIRSGYKQLMAYEIRGGGFEWFGHPPAHEALTAYGLIEFHEMKKVFEGVDEGMIGRTQNWLLSRRRGDGTFMQNRGKYGFSSASPEVNDAYIVYALTETGFTAVQKEYDRAIQEAFESRDMYRLALVANSAFNIGRIDDYKRALDEFRREVNKNGFILPGASHSVVRSYGNSLNIETVSLWALALMKDRGGDWEEVTRVVNYLLTKRSGSMFGSTQATTLALKALTEYARMVRAARESGDVVVSVNGKAALVGSYTAETNEPVKIKGLDPLLADGRNTISVAFHNTVNAMPYVVNVEWYGKTPASSSNCAVQLATQLARTSVKVNETVRLTAVLTNTTSQGLPMTMAVVGIPAGMSVQPWQLKELQEKAVFDFYEIKGDVLSLYYRELGPSEVRTINLDLKAEVPGKYTSRAGCAYLYYTNEHKHWVEGLKVNITR